MTWHWIRTTDRLPDPGKTVLIRIETTFRSYVVAYYGDEGWWSCETDMLIQVDVSHWCEITEPGGVG